MNAPFVDAALFAACTRIQTAVQGVAQRLVETLGQRGAGFASTSERQARTNAHFDLSRKLPLFARIFADTLRERVLEAAQPTKKATQPLAAFDADSLSLVEEHEVDDRVASERIAAQILQRCEAEFVQLGGYSASLLQQPMLEPQHNPLRPEVIARALRRAIHAATDDAPARQALESAFAAELGPTMKSCYAAIVADLQERGLKPTVLSVRTVQGPGNELPREVHREVSAYRTSGFGSISGGFPASARDLAQAEQMLSSLFGLAANAGTTAAGLPPGGDGPAIRAPGPAGHPGGSASTGAGGSAAARDAQMLAILRRLSLLTADAAVPAHASGAGPLGPAVSTPSGFLAGGLGRVAPTTTAGTGLPSGHHTTVTTTTRGPVTPLAGLMAVNVIRQHREELVRASTGALDHMVIDVVGALFDQVLSDDKVPPQLARQIARLQLPVLRAALKDVGFFSSRRHPVRRFVNRIASLAAAYEDLEHGPGKAFIDRVQSLVDEIVAGDFDQMELYDAKLHELEALVAEQAAHDVGPQAPVAALIVDKATQLRIQQRFMRELSIRLHEVPAPEFVRDFIAQVWSQVQVQAAGPAGPAGFAQRAARAARELVMSVQPKGDPALRKAFLMQLPQLMKDLNEGLALIRWPDEARKDFFAQLLPKHSESLKTTPLTDFEQRRLKFQLDQIEKVAIPTVADLDAPLTVPASLGPPSGAPPAPPAPAPSITAQEAAVSFSPEEAKSIGLVEEAAVDWTQAVDIELGSEPAKEDIDIVIDALAPEGRTPTHGPQLIHHLQTGIAYRMHLEGRWQRVRLNWISPGRAFFVFTHGKAHQKTISMTARMLTRMCDTERFRAFEQAELIERATARARKQLAQLGGASTQGAATTPG
ncbi:MAG TPA: DUF1631 family protein [Methylibium sp.]|uniref:DUF1631 family protein n=1 Tax=Methylibium sp. TaxID=2067992 RepID=UPI002DB5D376|nr:DUF1631 family protein [Methylibium sp.]HEU4459304.1 DUF1631 family protein [Methylibium sp.]